jgi:hypothetical protein
MNKYSQHITNVLHQEAKVAVGNSAILQTRHHIKKGLEYYRHISLIFAVDFMSLLTSWILIFRQKDELRLCPTGMSQDASRNLPS